jgi:hypothetical protein
VRLNRLAGDPRGVRHAALGVLVGSATSGGDAVERRNAESEGSESAHGQSLVGAPLTRFRSRSNNGRMSDGSFPLPLGAQFQLVSQMNGWVLAGHSGPWTEYPPDDSIIGRTGGVALNASDYWNNIWTTVYCQWGGVILQHVATGGYLGTNWKEWEPNNFCVLFNTPADANNWFTNSPFDGSIYHPWEAGPNWPAGTAFLELAAFWDAGNDAVDPANPDAYYSADFTLDSGNPNQLWNVQQL